MTSSRSDGTPLDLDGRSLRYFTMVAEELNFTRAARRLHVAQQTLSDSIRQLESHLGLRLLDRSPRSVALTPSGRAFLDGARQVLLAGEDAVSAARSAHRSVERVVLVGTPDWATGIERFRVALDRIGGAPNLRAEVSLLPWLEHLQAVADRRIDLGVTFLPRPAKLPDHLSSMSLGVERANIFVVPGDHRLAQVDDPSLGELARCRILLIDREQAPLLHDHLVDALRAQGIEPLLDRDRSRELSFSAALTHAGLHGSAVWVVRSMTSALPPGLVAVEIPELDVAVECVAIWRSDDANPALGSFIDALASS